MGEKSNALSMRSLRLFQRTTMIANMRISTRTKTPAEAKTAIIAGLLWRNDVPPPPVEEDWDSDGVRAWVARVLVNVATVVLGPGVAGTLGAELGRSVPERVEDVEEEDEDEEEEEEEEEEEMVELATGELIGESEGSGSVRPVVVLTLLKLGVEQKAFIVVYKLTMYPTKKQTVRTVRTARTMPDLLSFGCSELLLMRIEQRPDPGSVCLRRWYQPSVDLHET